MIQLDVKVCVVHEAWGSVLRSLVSTGRVRNLGRGTYILIVEASNPHTTRSLISGLIGQIHKGAGCVVLTRRFPHVKPCYGDL